MDPIQPQETTSKSMFKKVLLIILVFCIVVIVSYGGFVLGQQQKTITAKNETSMVQPTVTSQPTTNAMPTVATQITPAQLAQNPMQNYTDADIPFTLMYPKNWTLKKTYGKAVGNTSNNVLSGVQISDQTNTNTFVVNVIDSKNATNIVQWWQTGSHVAFSATQPNFSFKGLDAIKVSSTPGGNPPARVQDETYFLLKGKVYFISMQYTPYDINLDLVNIYNSFSIPQ